MTRPPFKFVGPEPSTETVETLQAMLDQAKTGELIGIAYSAIHKRRSWTYGTTGEAKRSPAFAVSMLFIQAVGIALNLLRPNGNKTS